MTDDRPTPVAARATDEHVRKYAFYVWHGAVDSGRWLKATDHEHALAMYLGRVTQRPPRVNVVQYESFPLDAKVTFEYTTNPQWVVKK